MTCAEFAAGLHAFFTGRMDSRLKRDLDAHAAGCEPCGALLLTAYETTCKELIDFLDEYVDGSLPPDRSAAFDRHLAICVECTAYVGSYRKTIASAREASADPEEVVKAMPEDLIRAIMKSIDDD
jgi:hypothetical protein